ncbi:TIR domain-containing protein [Nostoc sp.]|uniref:TIR domain-containing protein n=1 Tax=Nostoc sp. TaxID=1180 RepID=UPI002FF8B393
MKIFISWSGERSKALAKVLRVFLEDVNQRIEPWMSEADIQAGERWASRLAIELNNTDFGILCLTPENMNSPWLLFEAGALSKSITNGSVVPYLLDISKGIIKGPLSQFQSKEANRQGTWELLLAVNEAMKNGSLEKERLQRYFESFWPNLESEINKILSSFTPLPAELLNDLVHFISARYALNSEIRAIVMIAGGTDFLIANVNWNQAPFYVWTEVIQIMYKDKILVNLIDAVKDTTGVDNQEYLNKLVSRMKLNREETA